MTKFTGDLRYIKMNLESLPSITSGRKATQIPFLDISPPKLERNIGFLFNHEAPHQVDHIAPIIKALVDSNLRIKVTAMVSSETLLDRLRDIIGSQNNARVEIKKLEIPARWRWAMSKLNLLGPVQRLYILKRYVSLFETLDCLIVSETTSSILKTRLGLTTPLILLPHGAGDRAIGFGKAIKYYDYVLLSGIKIRDRMLNAGLIRADNHCIVGYPKFDMIMSRKREQGNYFNNTKPTILYNPHFEPKLSSWYKMGMEVLDFFADRPDYNLIVAPHIMLFKKKLHISLENGYFRFIKDIPSRYWKCPNIKIDLGSKCCINMDYVMSSDIYLGDVSSQVYEFLYRPRPCIFLNSHQADWLENPNYRHWHCGQVLDKVSDLTTSLENVEAIQKHFHDIQIKSFFETFYLQETPSSQSAAQAIVNFLDSKVPSSD